MNREEFGVALLLSVPIAVGVTLAGLRSTWGSRPLVSAATGLTLGAMVFGMVWLSTTTDSDAGRPAALAWVADRVIPEPREASPSSLLLAAGVGAVVTVFLWYIPLSPLLGGAAAGFLQGGSRADARTAGTLSGALVPAIALLVGVVAFLVSGEQVFGRFPFGPAVAVGVSLVGIVYAVGVGTVGGWVGGLALADDDPAGKPVELN